MYCNQSRKLTPDALFPLTLSTIVSQALQRLATGHSRRESIADLRLKQSSVNLTKKDENWVRLTFKPQQLRRQGSSSGSSTRQSEQQS